ncbi:XRE family transcriptional regulator [Brevibacillus nitrificans]|uniref:helix-turn-helix domain-containing protein n=1 Tax=Brevibacillus nitrificans TaxID=651560 RepID=UPI002E226854|nr:XRE family transcriptional regulator [Brevibacillus nitrificans]
MKVSEIVRTAMEQSGTTKSDLAKLTGYSYQYIYDLLGGKRRWHEQPINRVYDALGIKVSFNVEATSAQEPCEEVDQ